MSVLASCGKVCPGLPNGFIDGAVVPAVLPAPLSAAFFVVLTKLLTGSSVRWLGCEPGTRQRVYFANHTSHLDALVLWAALPPAARVLARPVAARDYWEADALRRHLALRVFNAVLIDRHRTAGEGHARNPLEPLFDALADPGGHSLIIFPEGTRGTGREPAGFKSGLYHLAKGRPEIDLVPTLIDNMNRILPKGELLPVPLLGGVSFGAPLRVGAGEGKAEFLARARGAVTALRDA